MENEINAERVAMIRTAIAACFAAREPANVDCIKAKLPEDFWIAEDGSEADDTDKFREIQSTFAATVAAERTESETRTDLRRGADPDLRRGAERDEQGPAGISEEPFPSHLPPSEHIAEPVEEVRSRGTDLPAPVVEIAEPVEQRLPSHAAKEQPGAQERLDAARLQEGSLLAEQRQLSYALRTARDALGTAKQALANADPNRITPEQNSAAYRKASQAERAARVARQGTGQPRIAYVDQARKFSTGGDGSDFARRQNVTGDRRRAFSRAEATANGFINRDPTRGGIPAPKPVARPTIPALSK